MKKLVLISLLTLSFFVHSFSNPIMLESLISEVYFENDNWTFVIDNWVLYQYGIEDFEFLYIDSSEGSLLLEWGFLPDPSGYTLLTNENLIIPVNFNRSAGWIFPYYDNPNSWYIQFTYVEWDDALPSPVCGPFEGQSLSAVYVPTYDFYGEWWYVKNNNPYLIGGNGSCYGNISGYVFDVYNNPVTNALIQYINPFYFQQPYCYFDSLITDENGYFEYLHLPARNYHITEIIKDNQQFMVDDYISVEPDTTLLYNFYIDYIVGQKNLSYKTIKIVNSPNPFKDNTKFLIDCNGIAMAAITSIQIWDDKGALIAVIPVDDYLMINNRIEVAWHNNNRFAPGSYVYSLTDGEKVLKTGKMIIAQ